MKTIIIGGLHVANHLPFTLIAGPCQIESERHALMMAEEIKKITDELGIPYIFKSSFDKANRTSVNSARGIGLEKSIRVFESVKALGIPVLTDVHEKEQCETLKSVVDVLQIPAFLCRQTDLLLSAGETGLTVNVKKGQFLSPWDMKNVVAKVESTGNYNIMLTERGTCFGYNTLVTDMRSLPIMAEIGYPVVIDATHAVQEPGGNGNSSGGDRTYVPVIAKAAVAVGVSAVFMEVHNDPKNAFSDGPNSVELDKLKEILKDLKRIDKAVKGY